MKTYVLESSLFVPKPLNDVFPFFDKAENLERMTPPMLSFKILTPKPVKMSHGTCIDYVVTILGIPTRWTSIIQNYEPPYQFVDTQLKGPYSLWHHTHTFYEENGGTLVKDRVVYGLPLGVLGRLAHLLFVKFQLKYIFKYRLKIMKELFNADLETAKLEFR